MGWIEIYFATGAGLFLIAFCYGIDRWADCAVKREMLQRRSRRVKGEG
jgi:hypothetical protein